MRLINHILLLVTLYFAVARSTEYAEIGDNVISYFRGSPVPEVKNILRFGHGIEDPDEIATRSSDADELIVKPIRKHKKERSINISPYSINYARESPSFEYKLENKYKRSRDDMKDVQNAADKVQIIKKAKAKEQLLNVGRGLDFPRPDDSGTGIARFHVDPVFNMLRSGQYRKHFRRKDDMSKDGSKDSSSDGSNDDNMDWKDEWTRLWRYKKYEALNASRPVGDSVNMVAARPWGVPCGDPNQHDMPWGNCMLAVECEAEYRIYRGDYFCGRSAFVCCALQVTTYDLYQGFDVSFDDKSLSTDSQERREADKSDKDKNKKKRNKAKKKRKKERQRRKKKIKKNIAKIVTEIRKILNKAYKNGTKERKRKTKMLKKFVKHLKKQYKKDRQSIKEIHEEVILKIDAALMARLNQIRAVNEQFMNNKTFADIVINGTINETGARMLIEAYPDLEPYFTRRRSGSNARNIRGKKTSADNPIKDYLDYDVEYGLLYY